jgi:outer membrane lipoprotein SlyB
MEQVIRTAPRLHPLVGAAAFSVIALSATGIAAFTGVLPLHHAAPAALVSTAAPISEALPVPAATNTVVIQNSTAPLQAADPVIKKAPKPAPARPIRTTYEQPSSSSSGPVSLPIAVSSSGSDPWIVPTQPQVAQAPAPVARVCIDCGVIESVNQVKKAGEAKGIGAVAGGLGGAVIGKQFGNGRGSTALAVLGAVGGAFAGHQVEKQVRSTTAYEVTVRMQDGSTRTVSQDSQPGWRPGERVRVDGNSISMI